VESDMSLAILRRPLLQRECQRPRRGIRRGSRHRREPRVLSSLRLSTRVLT
jgi:hypothetical protein